MEIKQALQAGIQFLPPDHPLRKQVTENLKKKSHVPGKKPQNGDVGKDERR